MCGIAGFITPLDSVANRTTVQRMINHMSHRGPDADGLWAEANVVLGHRRLSIIDLSETANQPFIDYSGRYVIVFNGEIYNYQSIRQRLADYPFRTHSDTEVVLAAYDRWGIECLHAFNGMFAFAIWDRQTARLFAVRDRLGKKPFYYAQVGESLLFGSEVRALLASDQIPRRLNRAVLPAYLQYQTVPAPGTLVESIWQLPAGHYAYYVNGQWQEAPWWQLTAPPAADPTIWQRPSTLHAHIGQLLRAAVARRMVSDVPLGAFLSGGIDSGAVVALMAEQSEQPVNTFTITFEETAYDESVEARAMARRFNTRHTELPLRPTQLLTEMPAILTSMDQPSGDGPNTYMVSKLTKEAGITVALSGLGGDEVFAGYSTFRRYARLRQLRLLWQLPKAVRMELLNRLSPNLNRQKMLDLAQLPSLDPLKLFPLFRQSASTAMINRLLNTSLNSNPFSSLLSTHWPTLRQLPPMSQLTVSELTTYTQPLLLRDADQMSMAHALELRVPLLDYELVEFMLQLPDSHKMNGHPKHLLVKSLDRLLPDELLTRPKKGFGFPWAVWLRHDLAHFCTQQIEQLAKRDLFDSATLRQFYNRFQAGDSSVSWNQIWLLVVLEHWLTEHNF
ncbi:asparagine synthase (glutamine-hydrolyzing) [Fibrella arboris]|uniref:asparagine synthase (glutamine-hydrolyzing) n=1 Tax=Fibrella arboris TaxID=3242486 RepID=UPI0035217570